MIETQEATIILEGRPKWIRYRFYTKSIDDPRPLIFNPKYAYWISGEGNGFSVIVAYLPSTENLFKYWDDAYNIESEESEIIFTGRFPKPEYYEETIQQ